MNSLSVLRKIPRWYLAPSGLLLLVALALLGVHVGSNEGVLVGLAGLALLALYFPYRSTRERARTDKKLDRVTTTMSNLASRIRSVEEESELSTHGLQLINTRIGDIKERLAGMEAMAAAQAPIDDRLVAASAMLTGSSYLPFNRRITDEALESIVAYWTDRLDLEVEGSQIRYLERKFVFVEGVCDGRVATTSTDVVIRCLIARSIAADTDSLKVLEIGTLFGLGAFAVYQAVAPFTDRCTLTLLDPLEGYYGNDRPDPATGIRVTEKVLWSNRDRLAIPRDDVRLIKGYSTDERIHASIDDVFDLLVIDGDHSYDGLRLDFELYAGFLREGGLLIVDDYGGEHWPDVKRYSDEVIKSDPRFEFVGAQSRTALFRRLSSPSS